MKNLVSTAEVQDEEFKNEVDNLMRVRHQNIVQFVGYCYETRKTYIDYNGNYVFAETPQMLLCFEYMPKGSLDRHIKGMTTQKGTLLVYKVPNSYIFI